MPAPTQPVTIRIADFGGPAVAGIKVTATPSAVDYTADGTFVSTEPVTGETDVDGEVVLNVFPCATVANGGLGTVGTTLRVTAQIPNSRPLDVSAAIPDQPCNLVDYVVSNEPLGLSGSEGAASRAQAARDLAIEEAAAAAGSAAAVKYIYPGVFAAAPATRPDGTAVQAGDRYNNSTDGFQYAYIGGVWTSAEKSAAESATTAATQAGTATTQAGLATTAAAAAALSETAAANYAAASASNYPFRDTIALGLAAVADGQNFGVYAGGSDGLTRPTTYTRLTVATYKKIGEWLSAAEYDLLFPALSGLSPAYVFMDGKGNTVWEVDSAGAMSVAALKATMLNGFSTASLRPTNMGMFPAELIFINNTGQSLAGGPIPAITTTQEHDNLGFPPLAVSPAATVALTAANCAQKSAGLVLAEPPMFGFASYLKQLLEHENGLRYTDHKFQLVCCDNSAGSYSITALNKGTALYNGAISQALATKTIADAANLIGMVGATLYTQGEANTAMAIATYQGYLSALATDYNNDYKLQTGQTTDVPFICYQTGSTPGGNVPLAQLAASLANPLIRIACAMGVFGYQDNLHIDSESSKWLGAYYALCLKRVLIDGLTWNPLRPIAVVGGGVGKKFVNVRHTAPVKPLVLDTTQIPAQSQSGFTMVDGGGVDIPITAVTVVAPDVVKYEVGSNLPAGAKLRTGFAAATGKGAYVGGACNLRDSQGDSVPLFAGLKRLDNWCLINEFPL